MRKELGFDVKSHASSVDTDVAEKLIKSFSAKKETVEKRSSRSGCQDNGCRREKEVAPVKKKRQLETKSVTPAAKPKSRNFKAEREARAKKQAERRKQQDNRQKRDRKDNQRHGDNRNQRPQERNEQRNQGSERRNNRPDQRRECHNPSGAKD